MKLIIESGNERCVSPESVSQKSPGDIASMFGTHDWDVDEGKQIGESGVLMHYNCKKCDAEGFSIVATKGTETSKLIENRVLNIV
jgi:hypothetical protein